MAGTYQQGEHKDLSGVYTRIVTAITSVMQGARGVVAYPFTASWGPVNELQDIYGETDFKNLYNAEDTGSTANKILTHAFNGRPSLVLGYRMGSGALKGKAPLPAGAGTGWSLETLYPSARALTVKVTDNLSGGKIVEIQEGGKSLAKVEANTVTDLATALNRTDFVRVETVGEALPDATAGVPFSGGSNGATVTGTEYTAFREVIEADGRARALALDTYEDAAEVAATVAWVRRVRSEGLYISFSNGGPLAWDNDTPAANTVSKGFNHRAFINVGNGADGYSAGDMAIFIAARAASVPLNRSITDENIPYARVNKKLTKSQRITAKKAGTLVFVQNGNFVQIDEGINTLTQIMDPELERLEFSKIRVSNTLDQIATDLEVFGDEYKKTRSNTPEARETYAALVEDSYYAPFVAQEILAAGATYRPDTEYHGPNAIYTAKIDEAYFVSGITPVDGMEKIYQKMGVNF